MLALRYSYKVISQVLRILKKHQNHLYITAFTKSAITMFLFKHKNIKYVLLNMYIHALCKQILIYDCLLNFSRYLDYEVSLCNNNPPLIV